MSLDKNLIISLGEEVRASLEEGHEFYSDLCGACTLASFMLHKKLSHVGIKSKFVKGVYQYYDHCWVEIDNIIVDITATQFDDDFDRVHFDTIENDDYQPEIKRFSKHYFLGWPSHQKPHLYNIKWNKNLSVKMKGI